MKHIKLFETVESAARQSMPSPAAKLVDGVLELGDNGGTLMIDEYGNFIFDVIVPTNQIWYTATSKLVETDVVEDSSTDPTAGLHVNSFSSSIVSHTFDETSGKGVIEFEEDLTAIGELAFYGCDDLLSVSLSPDYITIGEGAFDSCTSLNNVKINCNIITLYDYIFYGCSNLKSISLNGVDPIDFSENIFTGSSLEDVTIVFYAVKPTCTLSNTFANLTTLKKVYLECESPIVLYNTFYDCTNLEEITLNKGGVWTSTNKDQFECIPSTVNTIYVPSSLLDLYIESWPNHASKFKSIVE